MSAEQRGQTPFNPFLGLRPFTVEDAHLFFGCEGRTAEMMRRLARQRFLAVVGASGSGKSSLVGAGLVPGLLAQTRDDGTPIWRVARLRPGGEPVRNLARALASAGLLGEAEHPDLHRRLIEGTLRRSSLGLVQAVEQARIGQNVVVFVDQFEEIFRFVGGAGDHEQSTMLVNLLLEAIHQRRVPIYVCITMRSDFFGACSTFFGLPEAINDGQYLVPRMTREERKEAITGPMRVAGASLSNRLVQRLLNDLGDATADQLPTMQHALMRTFERWRADGTSGRPMDVEDYEAIGTIEHALDDHAEAVYGDLDEDGRRVAEAIFKRLTLRSGSLDVRYPTRLATLMEILGASLPELIAVIDRFRQPGTSFLMPSRVELRPETPIDISHESLIRIWRRLRRWVEEEAESARVYRRIYESAVLHTKGKADLLTGRDLRVAREWAASSLYNSAWADRYGGGYSVVRAFLEKSTRSEEERRDLEQQIAAAEAEATAMREQSAVLRQVLSSIPHRVFWKDRRSVYMGANAKFTELAGLESPDKIVGKTDFELAWTREESEYYRQCDEEVMASGEAMTQIEETQLTADGEEAVVLTDKVPLRNDDGVVNGILGISLDITERKRTEEALSAALRASEKRGERILDAREIVLRHLDRIEALLGLAEGAGSGKLGADEAKELASELKTLRRFARSWASGTR